MIFVSLSIISQEKENRDEFYKILLVRRPRFMSELCRDKKHGS